MPTISAKWLMSTLALVVANDNSTSSMAEKDNLLDPNSLLAMIVPSILITFSCRKLQLFAHCNDGSLKS